MSKRSMCETPECVFFLCITSYMPCIATRSIQIRSAPASRNISDHRTGAASRNNHTVGYVKRHSWQIFSVAISMPRSIYQPTITRNQGRTGAVINCIKLHGSKEKAKVYTKALMSFLIHDW